VNTFARFLLALALALALSQAATDLPAQQSAPEHSFTDRLRSDAEKGDALAQSTLGEALLLGKLGLAKDPSKAARWYRKAADQKYPAAELMLGLCYGDGSGVKRDQAEAVKWIRKAADQKLPRAQYEIGMRYFNGKGIAVNKAEAVEWITRAANQGFAPAECDLGICYAKGFLVERSEDEAVNWYRKSAESGYAKAQAALGNAYANGEGIPKDGVEAMRWLRRSADQNDANGQYYLGAFYAEGRAGTQDPSQALNWFRKAAKQGSALAQYDLAVSYLEGRGVSKDESEATKWFERAAEHDLPLAQFNLGVLYANGRGVPKSQFEAVKWWRKAAEHDLKMAQYNLAISYSDGDGVARDYVQAYKWAILAAVHRVRFAKETADGLERKLSKSQIAEGQKLAREFKPTPSSDPTLDLGTTESFPVSPSVTGFFITEDGYVVTDAQVRGTPLRLITASGVIPARVVKVDAGNGLALLKAEGKFTALTVAPGQPQLGSSVATVGFPAIGLQAFVPTLSKGEVASASGAGEDAHYFPTSASVRPGNSGGALIDQAGNVLGVVSSKSGRGDGSGANGAARDEVSFAVKSSVLLSFLDSVPEVASKLKAPAAKEGSFQEAAARAEQATVLVLGY
jgi:TPR repeat protein/S1-C subfamily serine protease